GRAPGRATELQRNEPVPMYGRRHLRGAGREVGAHGPPELAMRLDSGARELCPRREDEVAPQALPYEMEVVTVEPHVGAGAGDRVLAPRGIVDHRARVPGLAHVGLTVEDTERRLLGKRRHGRREQQPGPGSHVPEATTLHWGAP